MAFELQKSHVLKSTVKEPIYLITKHYHSFIALIVLFAAARDSTTADALHDARQLTPTTTTVTSSLFPATICSIHNAAAGWYESREHVTSTAILWKYEHEWSASYGADKSSNTGSANGKPNTEAFSRLYQLSAATTDAA